MGVQDNEGCSLLHWACFFGCDEILVEALLLANPHSARLPSRHDGSLPMHLAASWVRRRSSPATTDCMHWTDRTLYLLPL